MNLVILKQIVAELQSQVAGAVFDGAALSVADARFGAGVGGDDVAKINAAMTHATANGFTRAHLPAGTYVFDCQHIADPALHALVNVPSGVKMVTGDGPGRTIIRVINATTGAGGNGVSCFGVTSLNGVIFDGLTFVGENNPFTYVLNNQGCCIRVYASENVIIRNCRFESLWGFPCHDDGSTRVHLLDCSFEDVANGPNMNGDHSLVSRLSIKRSEGPECAGAYSVYSGWTIENGQGVGASLGGDQGAEKPGSVVSDISIDGVTGGSGMVLNDGFSFATVANVSIRNCEQSGLVVYQSGNIGAPTTRSIRFSNVTIDSNCADPNTGTIVGADISGDGGHDFFNCSFTDQAVTGFKQIQAFSLNAPNCSVDSCRFQGHTATLTNKDASFGPACTGLRLGTTNRFINSTQEFQAGCTIDPISLIGIDAADRVFEFRLWNDSPGSGRRRFALKRDGGMSWGDGLDLEDTNLYRSAADVLKTDDTFSTATGLLLVGQSFKSAAAAPVSGAHVVGEVVFNNAPASGGFAGWVCTTAGTPGTWKTWGVIS